MLTKRNPNINEGEKNNFATCVHFHPVALLQLQAMHSPLTIRGMSLPEQKLFHDYEHQAKSKYETGFVHCLWLQGDLKVKCAKFS